MTISGLELLIALGVFILFAVGLVLAVYFLIRSFLRREAQKAEMEIEESSQKTTLPLRLQAYERMALLLERINPESLVMRVNQPGMTARQLQNELIAAVRAEYEHNLSQQVYISSECWEMVRAARNSIITIINTAADQLKEDASAITLSQKIFEQVIQLKNPPVQQALEFLKREIRELY